MKAIIMLLTIVSLGLSFGCGKTPTETLDEMVSTEGMLKYTGDFRGIGSENVSGQAKIFLTSNQYMLKLENFSTSNGPDLKVYLSTESTPGDFISLGDLKSTNGNQVYNINGVPDFSKYKYVLIHCERYNHLFGSAEIRP